MSVLDRGEWSASRPCRFIPREKSPRYPLDTKLGGPQSQSGRCEEYKICLPSTSMLVSCLVYSSAPKMEATCTSETSVYFQRTTRCYVPIRWDSLKEKKSYAPAGNRTPATQPVAVTTEQQQQLMQRIEIMCGNRCLRRWRQKAGNNREEWPFCVGSQGS
jgi:hypothetical protein